MDVTRTEEEQLEALKEWWVKNGAPIIIGLVIGLGSVFGWRAWQTYQVKQAEAASDVYTKLIVDVRGNDNDKARDAANKIMSDYPHTGYVTYAALLLAKIDVDNDKLDDATKHLQLALDKADNVEMKHLARLRLARVQLANKQPEQALATLDVSDMGKFVATYQELKGDIYAYMNKPEQAKDAYLLALSEQNDKSGRNNTFLQMKIDNIGLLKQ